MSSTRFSLKSLRSEVRSTDGDEYGVNFAESIDQYIDDAEEIIIDPRDALERFNRFPLGSRLITSYTEYPTVLALRVLGTYLRRRYSLQTETRESVSRGVIQALADSSTMRIYRRDIASFYESIPTIGIKEDLLYRDVLPPRARRMLEIFFDAHCETGTGLPRGLGLSAILSEYAMKPVDAAIRLLPGVYRYHRFVDDIVIFATTLNKVVSKELASALPSPMQLNRSRAKCDNVVLARPHGENSSSVMFEYLGYSYKISLAHSPKKPRDVRVGIARSKINKIKSRMLLSARDFRRNGNVNLFIDRVKYLTGNYRFVKRRPISTTGSSVVKSGIFYNYRYCGSYRGNVKTRHDMAELKELDWFLQHTILGSRHELGSAVVQALTDAQLALIRRLSFKQGHLKVFDCRFDSERVSQIREAWTHV